jgi:F-type H+-transporting ATPase subunit a
MEHESSILFAPVNALWHSVQHRFAWDIPDHVIMALVVLLISMIVFPLMARKISRENPGHFQQMLELVVGGLKTLLRDIIGHDGDRYLYIIGSFAAFIFVSNIFGLFFFLQPPTSNPNTTFGLALCAFLYYNWQGIRSQGLGHYLKHFMGPMPILAPLMIPIEIIGHLARILSLGMRLFGNIFGEHTATGIFMGMLPFVLPWPMMGLGIFGAFLQTFVFIMLTMVYIAGATVVEEH